MASESVLDADSDLFRKFLLYAGAVLLKTILMSVWTSNYRIKKSIYVSPDDYQPLTGKPAPKPLPVDPHIERIRRAHQNDLENVLPFVLIGLLYVSSAPSAFLAVLHFRVFTIARFMHTAVYLNSVPQPARVLCFIAGFLVNLSMVIQVIASGVF